MITILTPDQIELMPVVRDEWIGFGLSTEPIIREQVELSAKLLYENAGLKCPDEIYFFDSPVSLCIGDAFLTNFVRAPVESSVGASVQTSVGASVWDSVRDSVQTSVEASVGTSVGNSVQTSVRNSVWASVWASVGASVRASVWDSVRDSVRDSVGNSVQTSVRNSVWASVWASVGASVRASVWDSVWDSVRDSVRDSVGNSVRTSVGDFVGTFVWDSVRDSVKNSVGASINSFLECSTMAFFDYFRQIGLVDQTEKARGLSEMHKSCGWFIPRSGVLLVSARPTHIHLDEFGRLHSENDMAIKYNDGWGVYAIGGVVVPEKVVIAPSSLTPQEIKEERNSEVRRIMVERFGPEQYFDAIGAEVVDGDFTEVTRGGRRMPRFLLRDSAGDMWLIGTDGSTSRTYTMPAPQGVQSCKEAHQMICGLDESKCIAQS